MGKMTHLLPLTFAEGGCSIPAMSDDLLTIEEAARVARCSGNAIRRAVAAGRIQTVAVQRGPLMVLDMIHRRDAERFTLTYPANEAKRRARFKGRGKG